MRWSYSDLLATPEPVIDVLVRVMVDEYEERRREERERERKSAAKRGRR